MYMFIIDVGFLNQNLDESIEIYLVAGHGNVVSEGPLVKQEFFSKES